MNARLFMLCGHAINVSEKVVCRHHTTGFVPPPASFPVSCTAAAADQSRKQQQHSQTTAAPTEERDFVLIYANVRIGRVHSSPPSIERWMGEWMDMIFSSAAGILCGQFTDRRNRLSLAPISTYSSDYDQRLKSD